MLKPPGLGLAGAQQLQSHSQQVNISKDALSRLKVLAQFDRKIILCVLPDG